MSVAKRRVKAAVPRLRFPEFRNSENWELRKLNYFLVEQKERNKNLNFGPQEVLSVSGEHGCVNQIELLGRSYAGTSVANYHIVETGDIVYTKSPLKRNPFGIIKENKGKSGIVSTLYAVYRATVAGHPSFLDHYFSGDYNLNSYLQPIVRKGAKNDMKVNNAAVLGGEIFAPQIEEQKKVAHFLTSLDDLIVVQTRKVEALKTHKRGLMQQLFPREGETRPRLRFPEFYDVPEWREEKLGELTSIVRGGSPRPIDNFLTSNADGLNWLKIGDVDREAMYVTKTEEKVRPEALSKTRVIQPGDFILSNSMSFGRPYISAIETCIHDGWIAITRIPDSLNREFLYYSILSERSQGYFVDQAAGSGVQNLNKDIIKLLPLSLPMVEEQQCIADVLSSLDVQIAAESAQLAALKTHKQGLMQQLFPAPGSN